MVIKASKNDNPSGHDCAPGWGECSALNSPTYSAEWAAGSFALLKSGATIDPREAPMTAAGVEMALLDLELKAKGQSLAHYLQSRYLNPMVNEGITSATPRSAVGGSEPKKRVMAGAVVGLSDADSTSQSVDALVAEGYRRVKLKATPAHHSQLAAIRQRHPELELQLDGNGSFAASDVELLAELAAEHRLSAIEQPFAIDDYSSARALVAATSVPVLADEAATSLAAIIELHNRGALSGVVIKPSRLAGLAGAVEVLTWAGVKQVPVSLGGMLECGLGRHSLAALAGLGLDSVSGDLGPARRWLAADPWRDLVLENGEIEIPTSPGVAPSPDAELLERYTIDQASIALPTLSAT